MAVLPTDEGREAIQPSSEMTEQERLVVSGLLDWAEKVAVPIETELEEIIHDHHESFDAEGRERPEILEARRRVRMASARDGYYAMFCPPSIGGSGFGARLSFFCWESLHVRHGPGHRLPYSSIAHWSNGPSAVWANVGPELKEHVLPRVMSGEITGAFGMSEPDAGSDAWRMKTRAVRDGDDWLISGSKQWTSSAPTSDYVLVFAVTDPELAASQKAGVTCFFMPKTTPGFSIDSVIRMFGEAGGREAICSFDDARVPDRYRLGDLHQGFRLAMIGANQGRFYNSARSVGLSRWAIDRATTYAKGRFAFGNAISEYQAIQFMLADSAVETYAARSMALDAATKADAGRGTRYEAAMAKLFASNTAVRVLDRAMQIHGAMGLTNEMRLFDGWKAVRAIRIADGTDEILRRTIAKRVLQGSLDF